MALNYTTFFTVIGKYVKTLNIFANSNGDFFNKIQIGINDCENILEANSLNHLVTNLHPTMELFKRDVERWADSLTGEVRTVMSDSSFVLENLVLFDSDFDAIINEIMSDMKSQSQTIKANSVIATASATGFSSKPTIEILVANFGSGLDGISSPARNWPASRHYNELESEGTITEGLTPTYLECVSAPNDGSELLKWIALFPETLAYRSEVESPGNSENIPISSSENIIDSNSEFEEFVNGVPTGWTVTGGNAGTDYGEYNIGFRGNKSLVIKDQAITVTRPITNLTSGKGYFVSIEVGDQILPEDHTNTKSGSQSDAIDVSVTGTKLDGSTYTSSAAIVNPQYAAVDDDWQTTYRFFSLPFDIVVSTVTLSIAVTPFAGDWTLIDEAILAPAHYYNGNAYAVSRGQITDQLELGDRADAAINLQLSTGIFQTFFAKAFNYMLPSDNSSSETIPDSLAQ